MYVCANAAGAKAKAMTAIRLIISFSVPPALTTNDGVQCHNKLRTIGRVRVPGDRGSRLPSMILMRSMMVTALAAFTACASVPTTPATFQLTSADFAAGGNLPDSVVLNGLDCHGSNISPALHWSGAPAGTKGFALVLDDYEARGGDGFVHWAAYDIPAEATGLP